MCLLIRPQHQVNAVNPADGLCRELCVAAGNYDKGSGMVTHQPMDGLPTFMVGHIGHRAGVNQTKIGLFTLTGGNNAHLL